MFLGFHDLKKTIKDQEQFIMKLMSQRFEKLKAAGFDYSKINDMDLYDLDEKLMEMSIMQMQSYLDFVRTWNYPMHRQRIMHDYEEHMKRAGDYL